AMVAAAAQSRQRIPGFGSPMHPRGDPRVAPLQAAAKQAGVWGDHCVLYAAIEQALAAAGKPLPANEVGLMAGVLCDLGLDPQQGEAVSIIGAVPSICANVLAEWKRPARFLVARPLLG